ncbi:MAG: CIA30 family protein [Proteobacteria bacterium]|nr:CIA30 family protein [Pseudomonadota bacterium]
MGGLSSSTMLAGDGVGIFAGELSLERGGGFASVRRRDEAIDLSTCDPAAPSAPRRRGIRQDLEHSARPGALADVWVNRTIVV